MSIMIHCDYITPLLNSIYRRSEETVIPVYEGWRGIGPIFRAHKVKGSLDLQVISYSEIKSSMMKIVEEVSYTDLVLNVIKACGFYPSKEIVPLRKLYEELSGSRDLVRGDRPIWFFYDTCALLNNMPYVFRRMIPDLVKHSAHTTSMGVQNEIEEKLDMRFKSREALVNYRDIYGNGTDDFYLQPYRIGRIARLAYPEVDLMRHNLGRNIIENGETGDTGIINAFHTEARSMNIEPIVVTCDKIMAERAENRGMRAWYVHPSDKIEAEISIKLSDLALMIYRASIIYGSVRIGKDVFVKGIWNGKTHDDWKSEMVKIESPYDGDLLSLFKLMSDIKNAS